MNQHSDQIYALFSIHYIFYLQLLHRKHVYRRRSRGWFCSLRRPHGGSKSLFRLPGRTSDGVAWWRQWSSPDPGADTGTSTSTGTDTALETGNDDVVDGNAPKKKSTRKPNELGIGQIVVTEIHPLKLELTTPEEARKCWGNQLG